MALDSTKPVDSIESAKYTDNKTDKTVSILEQISTGRDEQTEITNRLAIKNLIGELNDREKEIIIKRYGLNGEDEITQKEIATTLGISRSYVSRIEKRALTKMLREYIKNKNDNV